MLRLFCLLFLLCPPSALALEALDTFDAKTTTQYYAAGYDSQKKGDFLRARIFYELAESISPDDPRLQNDIGLVYEALGNKEEAEKHYLKAIALDYRCLPAYSNLAHLYESMGKIDLAARYFDQRVKVGNASDPWTLQAQIELDRLIRQSPHLSARKLAAEEKVLENAMILRTQESIRLEEQKMLGGAEMDYLAGLEFFNAYEYRQAKAAFESCLIKNPHHRRAQEMLSRTDTFLVIDPSGERFIPGKDPVVDDYTDAFQRQHQRILRQQAFGMDRSVAQENLRRNAAIEDSFYEAEPWRVSGQ